MILVIWKLIPGKKVIDGFIDLDKVTYIKKSDSWDSIVVGMNDDKFEIPKNGFEIEIVKDSPEYMKEKVIKEVAIDMLKND